MKTKMLIKNQKGAAIVEFGIILPLLVLMVMGICEFGLLWYNSQVIVNASREGARAGIIRGANFSDNLTIRSIVKTYANPRLVDFNGTILADPDIIFTPLNEATRATAAFGTDFEVEINYNYSFLVPSLFHLSLPKKIVGRTLMKMEQIGP